jgi:vacuolar-type H+-ATPase subunit E/Vma4
MALEDIFRALEEQAEQECQQILEDARDQADGIIEEANDKAREIRDNMVAETERTTRRKASQSVNSARLETKKKVAALKQDAVAGVFDKALDGMRALRNTAAYPATFKALTKEAVAGLESEPEVLVDAADVDLARRTLEEFGVTAAIRPEISTSGGLVVATDGGRIMRRNTLEDRLGKIRQFIQADVAEILFS